jgi:hypothetical protein
MDPWIGISIAAPMKIFSFDAETDGLYGPVWAIGAVVSEEPNAEGTVFAGRIEPTDEVVTDSWVRDNIVPYGLESHWSFREFSSREDLLNAFWDFWIEHCNDALVLADCGTPVEAGLFRACVELDLENRKWQRPKPLHELATALLLAGHDPWETDRRELSGKTKLVQHDPVDDALAAALCWEKVTAPFITESVETGNGE